MAQRQDAEICIMNEKRTIIIVITNRGNLRNRPMSLIFMRSKKTTFAKMY